MLISFLWHWVCTKFANQLGNYLKFIGHWERPNLLEVNAKGCQVHLISSKMIALPG